MKVSKMTHEEKCALLGKLIKTPTSELSSKDAAIKGKLLSEIDIINDPEMEKYIDFPTSRTLVGKIEGEFFIPAQSDFEGMRIPIPKLLQPTDPKNPDRWYFATVSIFKDGWPKCEEDSIIKIKPT